MAFEKDSAIHDEKIESKMDQMSKEEMDSILDNFEHFKSYLHDKVSKGEKLGLSEDILAKAAKTAAEYLANNAEPKNREEYLLKELWKSGNDEQRTHLSHILVKLAKNEA
ncbi:MULTISPECIES: DUF3243 domain-containing protein [Bacillaceae]|uniref:DUF3243 domain-containing protein n=1 Tax=Metabacillus sediminis TaxID=3117746 RepID=A0ABZ2NFN3_9BACI|nr:DUF3243 domain-containing protein [Bacillus sp. SJS]